MKNYIPIQNRVRSVTYITLAFTTLFSWIGTLFIVICDEKVLFVIKLHGYQPVFTVAWNMNGSNYVYIWRGLKTREITHSGSSNACR